MKKFFTTIALAFIASQSFAGAPVKTITGNLTGTINWVADTIYLLQGKVYVKSGATLNIAPGTIIKGDKNTPGSTLVITRGAKIFAVGTPTKPIVFTSSAPAGSRATADWGGLAIAGNARINVAGGVAPFEGGNLANPDGTTTDGSYGGLNDLDNSGALKYVRIEYAGFPFQTNSELNSLTFGGVGSGTEVDYVQCSHGFDDAFEFFGGTVNAKHLVAFRGNDDDFDTDFGYRGNIQFAVAFRDSAIADAVSGANAFESDNDGAGSGNSPYTAPVFSNFTVIGPKQTATTVSNSNFKSGVHFKKNTRLNLFNTVITGFPTGIKMDGDSCHANANSLALECNQVVLAACPRLLDSTGGSAWGITNWWSTAASNNSNYNLLADLMLTNPLSYSAPNLLPMTGSPLLSGASFTNAKLTNSFFTPTTYKGAFGADNWMESWTNFNPNAEAYEYGYGVSPLDVKDAKNAANYFTVSPNPATNNITLNISASANISNAEYAIINANGQILKNQKLNATNGIQNIDVSNLAAGFYTISLKSNAFVATQKLVIAK